MRKRPDLKNVKILHVDEKGYMVVAEKFTADSKCYIKLLSPELEEVKVLGDVEGIHGGDVEDGLHGEFAGKGLQFDIENGAMFWLNNEDDISVVRLVTRFI
jgi:hypothetical protein